MLNRKQRIVLYIGIVLLVLSFLFPKWDARYENGTICPYRNPGHRLIFIPPEFRVPNGDINRDFLGTIDYKLLILQMSVIALVSLGLIVAFKKEKNSN